MWLLALLFFALSTWAQPQLLDRSFPAGEGPNDFVRSIAVQSNQLVLVAGNFSTFNGVEIGPLVRLLPNGSLDPEFKPGPFQDASGARLTRVQTLTDGRTLVHGTFTSVGNKAWKNIAVLRADGTVDSNFNFPPVYPAAPTSSPITALIPASDGGFFVTGNFTNLGTTFSPRLGKLRADGSVDSSFRSPFSKMDQSALSVLPLRDGKVMLTGTFTNIAGVAVPRIARLLENGALDLSFRPELPDTTQLRGVVLMPDDSMIGTVSDISGLTLDEPLTLLRLLSNGAVDKNFAPRFSYPETVSSAFNRVLSMLPEPDGSLVLTGSFLEIDGQERYFLARLLPDGSLSECFNPGLGPSSFVIAMARQNDGRILLGGVFRAVEGQHRPYLARLEPHSDCGAGTFSFSSSEFVANEGSPTALITVVRKGARAQAQQVRVETTGGAAQSPDDYQAGAFDLVFAPGERAKSVSIPLRSDALIEGDETILLKLISPSAVVSEPATATLRIIDQTDFRLAGAVDPSFRPAIDGVVRAAAVRPSGEWLVAVGLTNSSGYVDYIHSLRLIETNGAVSRTFTTNLFDGEVYTVAFLSDGRLVAGGGFQKVNGVVMPGLARFSRDGVLDTSFHPFPEDTNSFRYPTVTALLVSPDDTLFCAGKLPETTNAVYGFRLFKISPTGNLDTDFLSTQERQPNGATALLRALDGSYIAAIPDTASLARIAPSGTRDPQFIPPAYSPAGAQSLLELPDHSIIAAGPGTFYSGFNAPSLVRLAPNGGELVAFRANAERSMDLVHSSISRVLSQPDGRFLAAGTFQFGTDPAQTAVLRFNADGSWDPSFVSGSGAESRSSIFIGSSEAIGPDIHVLEPFPGGGWLVGGDFAGFDGTLQPFLVRLLPTRDAAQRFHLAIENYSVSESIGTLWIDVLRAGTAEQSASVRIDTETLSALPNIHFTPVDHQLTFAPGEWVKRVPIGIIPNNAVEEDRIFRVSLHSTGETAINSPKSALVSIVDDDINVQFIADSFTAIEGEPYARIGIQRLGATDKPITVEVDTGREKSLVQFAAAQTATVTNYLDIPIRDDDEYSPNTTETLRLRVLTGNATVGLRSSASVRIQENDFPQSVGRGVAGVINAMAAAPDGGVYLAGDFTAVHGQQRKNIARLLPNGEVDRTFDSLPGPNGAITTILVQSDGRILIAGDFSSVNNQSRIQLARLLPDGTLDDSFSPGSGPISVEDYPQRIFALAQSTNGSIFAGGRFAEFQDYATHGVVRISSNGVVDRTFTSALTRSYSRSIFPYFGTPGPLSTVTQLHCKPDGSLAVVGELYALGKANVTLTASLLPLKEDGSLDTNFVLQVTNAPISTLTPLANGSWLAGAALSGSQVIRRQPPFTSSWVPILRLQPNGQIDTGFSVRGAPTFQNTSVEVRQIALDSDGRILFLAELGGTNALRLGRTLLARLLPDFTWDESFHWQIATNRFPTVATPKYSFNDPRNQPFVDPEPAASIRSLVQQTDGTIVIGGTFNELNDVPRHRLARIEPDGDVRGRFALFVEMLSENLLELSTAPEIEIPYTIESSADLFEWSPVRTNNIPWSPLSIYIESPVAGPHLFFRSRPLSDAN